MDLARIRDAAERVARSEGLEVFDVEWKIGKQRFLRVYLDRLPGPGNPEGIGVSHNDCQRVSEQLSVILDVEDLVPGPGYILEVSSPGLDRKLTKPEDFQRFKGSLVKIQTFEPIRNNRHWQGRLVGFSERAGTEVPSQVSESSPPPHEGEDVRGDGGNPGAPSVTLDLAAVRQNSKSRKAGVSTVEIALSNIEKAQLVPEI